MRHWLHLADQVDPVDERAAEPPLIARQLDAVQAQRSGGRAHGHRLQAATTIASAGKSSVRCPRVISTRPSSSGSRSASTALRGELGELVEEEHPAVRERDLARHRRSAAADEALRRDGVMRRAERALAWRAARRRCPPALCIRVISSASSKLGGGRIPGRRRASIVLPAPGGPTISRL